MNKLLTISSNYSTLNCSKSIIRFRIARGKDNFILIFNLLLNDCLFLGETMNFENTKIQNCARGVSVIGGQAVFNNVTFFKNSYGIYSEESTVEITNSYLSHNEHAIYVIRSSTLLISFTQLNDNTISSEGAGIYADSGSKVVVNDCSFFRNRALGGAAVRSDNCSLSFSSCVFEDNVATSGGGVMQFLTRAKVNFYNCNFTNNTANSGGVFSLNASSLTICNSSFVNNHASKNGGVFHSLNLDNSLNISHSSFQFNTAEYGGVIYGDNCNFQLNSSSFSNNHVSASGGVICSENSNIELYSSSFSNNYANYYGGVAKIYLSKASSYSSQYLYNSARAGGSIYSENSIVQLYSSNFVSNSAEYGAAVADSEGSTLVENCTFEFNTGVDICYFFVSSSIHILDSRFYNNSGRACCFLGTSSVMVTDSSFHGGIMSEESGGGMYLFQVTNFISSNCIFSDNEATYDGGAWYSEGSSSKWTNVTVERCISSTGAIYMVDSSTSEIDKSRISNNNEGGVMVNGSNLIVTDSIITNNRYDSSDGGGIFATFGAKVTMKQIECSFNAARNYGGCVYVDDGSSLVTQNCAIISNAAENGGGIYVGEYSTGILTNFKYSDFF